MQQSRAMEVSTGLFVLLGFAALLFLATQITNRDVGANGKSYELMARYENIGGLKVGAPVSMAGVTVGRVEAITLDQNLYKAVVKMRVKDEFNKIPDDSDAAIMTSGLLGGQYIGVSAGGSETYLKAGGQFQFVQDALVLENLINRLVANFASKKDSDAAPETKK
jgi:phospholipid/cholesterol/gamma-HCH transport system substrate-binding protein